MNAFSGAHYFHRVEIKFDIISRLKEAGSWWWREERGFITFADLEAVRLQHRDDDCQRIVFVSPVLLCTLQHNCHRRMKRSINAADLWQLIPLAPDTECMRYTNTHRFFFFYTDNFYISVYFTTHTSTCSDSCKRMCVCVCVWGFARGWLCLNYNLGIKKDIEDYIRQQSAIITTHTLFSIIHVPSIRLHTFTYSTYTYTLLLSHSLARRLCLRLPHHQLKPTSLRAMQHCEKYTTHSLKAIAQCAHMSQWGHLIERRPHVRLWRSVLTAMTLS